MADMQTQRNTDEIADLRVKVAGIEADVRAAKENTEKLVTRTEFMPVKLIAYGMAATVLSSALIAILSKVFPK